MVHEALMYTKIFLSQKYRFQIRLCIKIIGEGPEIKEILYNLYLESKRIFWILQFYIQIDMIVQQTKNRFTMANQAKK